MFYIRMREHVTRCIVQGRESTLKEVLYKDEGARYKMYCINMREHVTRCVV